MAGPNEMAMIKLAASIDSFVIQGALEFASGVLELSNEGGEGAPAAPIDTGELRGSPDVTFNVKSTEISDGNPPFPLTTVAELRRAAQLAGFDVGDVLWIRWTAKHAEINEGGRRLGSHGRMIGSEQAPDGWVEPGIQTMSSRMDRWRFEDRAI